MFVFLLFNLLSIFKSFYIFCLKKVYKYADFITVNISSPNTPDLRKLQFGEALESLLSQLNSEKEKLIIDRDLENARHIQNSLLPSQIPLMDNLEISGVMLPAMQVGGDYFDVIKVSDSKVFVIVGDVSGKGLAASFYMSKLQTMVRLYCNAENSPSDVLTKINYRLFKEMEKNWFITATIALFDTEKNNVKRHSINFCNGTSTISHAFIWNTYQTIVVTHKHFFETCWNYNCCCYGNSRLIKFF